MRVRLTLLSLGLALSAPIGVHADDLIDIYEKAVLSDPLLREAEANRLATLEAKPQARGVLLPQISGRASYDWDESDGSNVFPQVLTQDIPGAGNAGDVIIATRQFDGDSETLVWTLELRQSIFRWDQWVRLKQADKTVAQAEVDYRAAQQDLMTRVATAYFDVLASEDTLASEQAAKEAIGRQLEQAQKRFEVGLIAITDVQEAQAAYDEAVAAEIVAKRTLANRREVLREITGQYTENLESPGEQFPLVSPVPADEDQWVETALQQNLALMSADIGAEITRDDVSIAKTGHYPTLDLVVGRTEIDAEGDQATGIQSAIGGTGQLGAAQPTDFDTTGDSISLQFALPIFSGGTTSSQVREASYRHRAAKERLERVARETEREARDAYLGVMSDIARVKALRQAMQSAQTALQATEAGFEVGTRTTVDVLDARRALFLAETNFLRSRYDYIINVLRLKQAAGTLTVEDLVEVNGWLLNNPGNPDAAASTSGATRID
jgi:outer membrane protein